MCTVVIEVPERPELPTRLLAVRDEDPQRPWDGPGPWWPELPDVIGVRDRLAGGAWLAARESAGALAVLVNRAAVVPEPATGFTSRGRIVLDAVSGEALADAPTTQAFTLVAVVGGHAATVAWDGVQLRREALTPGVHMLAHDEVDDARTPRIARWLPEFQALAGVSDWRSRWITQLAATAQLDSTDDRAIIRDNVPHGYPTKSLLACVAEVSDAAVSLEWAQLAQPGHWDAPSFTGASFGGASSIS